MSGRSRTAEPDLPLEVEWHVVDPSFTAEDRERVLRRLPQLSRAVRAFPRRTLHVEVEANPRKGGYGVSVSLALPRKTLFAAEWARDPATAGNRAMDRVARLVRREIVHDASLAGVPKEAISVPDVVDEALVWTLENVGRRPAYLSPEQFLWRRVLHQIDLARESVLRSRRGEAEEAAVASRHVEPNPELDMEWEEAEDLIFGGGEPLPLDLGEAAPEGSDPAAILDREAAQRAVSEALRRLPEGQRRAILLHDLEGYDPEEIAFVLSSGEARVRRDLRLARRTLRRRLKAFA